MKKKYNEVFRGVYVFRIRKNLKLNLVLFLVVLVVESKGLFLLQTENKFTNHVIP